MVLASESNLITFPKIPLCKLHMTEIRVKKQRADSANGGKKEKWKWHACGTKLQHTEQFTHIQNIYLLFLFTFADSKAEAGSR